jgi:hypothetical protein
LKGAYDLDKDADITLRAPPTATAPGLASLPAI